LSMADRVAVLEGGRLQQFGTPRDLYEAPASAFVADFIGETSFIPVTVLSAGNAVEVAVHCLHMQCRLPSSRVLSGNGPARLAVRPESVRLELSDQGEGSVVESAYAGTTQVVLVDVNGVRLLSRTRMNPATPLFHAGQRVQVQVDTTHAMVYPGE
jgi:ABC-type Fe3+/spermidine/putrescine transport system ATPase subunit